jgi:thiol peroxidase
MFGTRFPAVIGIAMIWIAAGCASAPPPIPVERGSVDPGSSVARGEKRFKLLGTPVQVGQPLPRVSLVDATSLREVDLSEERGSVLLLSIVPSLDTRVCDAQTHYLGEKGGGLPEGVRRIVISRDTPFAQKRFAREANLTQLEYFSDYKEGGFGRATGLLVEGSMLLARAVVLVDGRGVVRAIQVVPELTHLPDMEAAFAGAARLARP